MRQFLKRLRGMLRMGVAWALVWAAVLFAIGLVIGVVDPDSIDPGEEPHRIAGIGAMVGFIMGAGFGGVLALTERRKTIRDLSVWRAAVWGGLVPAALTLLTPLNNDMMFLLCPISAALAAACIAIAKRGERKSAAEGQAVSV